MLIAPQLNTTYSDNPACRSLQDGIAYTTIRCLTTRSSCCARIAVPHTQGVALKWILSRLMFSSSCQKTVGESPSWSRKSHGAFHAKSSLVFRHNLIVSISDEAWDRLEDPDTQKWLRKWVPLRMVLQKVPFFKKSRVHLGKLKQIGRTGNAFSHRSRWPGQQAFYLTFSQIN